MVQCVMAEINKTQEYTLVIYELEVFAFLIEKKECAFV